MSEQVSLKTRIVAAVGVAAAAGFGIGALVVSESGGTSRSGLALSLIGVAVTLGAAVVGVYFGRAALRPLERLASWAGRVAEGAESDPPDETAPVEVRRVEENVAAMADRLIDQKERLEENVQSLNRTNRELIQARDELVRAERLASVGRLAAGIAHEVGNPLNSILSLLDLLRQREDESLVEHLESEARRIDEIINGLLDFARPEEVPVTPTDPAEVVAGTIELLRVQGRLDEVDVTLEDGTTGLLVEANPDQLQQVLVNLLLNAADAAEESAGESEIRIRVMADAFGVDPIERDYSVRRSDDPEGVDYRHLRRAEEPPGQFRRPSLDEDDPVARVDILDTGPGLDRDTQARIFDPFFTTKEPGEGMGLGLAIAARLTEQMGGVVEVRNRPEGGAAFAVLLPTAEGR